MSVDPRALRVLLKVASPEQREEVFKSLSPEAMAKLSRDWWIVARDEQLPPHGNWTYWLYLAGRGAGKQLCVDTPIPTHHGWKRNGDLCAGDTVFDEGGKPCNVTAVHPIEVPDDCFRITFSDGSEIDACGRHLWTTWTHRARKQAYRHGGGSSGEGWPFFRTNLHTNTGQVIGTTGPETLSTAEILATLRQGSRGDLNHSIPCCYPLVLPEIPLPIDPWVLGYWLGNGCCDTGQITSGSHAGQMDYDFVARKIASAGLVAKTTVYNLRGHASHFPLGLGPALRGAGVIEQKLIPSAYLRSSIAQRTEFLRGLMDSDGYASAMERSGVEFSSTKRNIAEDVLELVTTLGERASISEDRARLNGADHGPRFRVTWTPSLFNPFSLPRKASRVSFASRQTERTRHRMIVAIDPIAPKPMRCITVDSSSSMYLAGRAMIPTHNTRSGAEWSIEQARTRPGSIGSLVAPTAGDIERVMVAGQSGILACSPNDFRPRWIGSKNKLVWPNGSTANCFSAEEPERLRGPQANWAWCDELAAWKRLQETWDQLQFGLRLPPDPRCYISTTPRPLPLVKQLSGPWEKAGRSVVTRGSTYDNKANLSEKFFQEVISKYEGTRLGRQELQADILEDVPGALWTLDKIDETRLSVAPDDLARVVVSIDPPATSGEDADECGICVAARGSDGRGYVLADLTSHRDKPNEWATRAVTAYHQYNADRIVAEANNGGEMVAEVIRQVDATVPVKLVYASRGKVTRAEPISALYEQGRVSHVGSFPKLEDQLTSFTPDFDRKKMGYSPDRVDALVWALTELMLGFIADNSIFAPVQVGAERNNLL